MVSIHTNTGAMSALATLRATSSGLAKAQEQISSGYRVSTASDNAAYWSIATTMRAETKSLSAVSDSIGLARGIVDTAYSGMEKVLDSMNAIRDLAVQAANMPAPGVTYLTNFEDPKYWGTSVGKIDRSIMQHVEAIRSTVASSSFAGVNLLTNAKGQPDLTATSQIEFVVGAVGGSVQTTSLRLEETVIFNYARTYDPGTLIGPQFETGPPWGHLDSPHVFGTWLFNFTKSDGTGAYDTPSPYFLRNGEYEVAAGNENRSDAYELLVQQLDAKVKALIDGMAAVGAVSKTLETMEETNLRRIATVKKGTGLLVDADMNEASTRLKALQTQEQLGIQSLQIANSAPESILALFR